MESKLGNLDLNYALVDEIDPHPENANVGDVDTIAESIRVNGFYAPIIVQASTGFIIAGNHRYQAAKKLGMEQVPVVYLDVEDDEAKRIMVADNRTTRLGHDNDELLTSLLEDLGDTELGLMGTGFTHADLQTLIDNADKFDPEFTSEPDSVPTHGTEDSAYQVEAIPGAGGKCIGLMVNRIDGDPLSVDDYQHIRVALGLGVIPRGAAATLGIEDWE
jgi:hypothetical protein